MKELINKIAETDNVTGFEISMYSVINEYTDKDYFDLTFFDNRSVSVKIKNSTPENFIALPLDVSGYFAIPDDNKSYLIPSHIRSSAKSLENASLISNGEIFKVKSGKDAPQRCEDFYILKRLALGTPLKLYSDIKVNSINASGVNASVYAEIAYSLLNIKNIINENLGIVFLAQISHNTYSAVNFCNQNKIKNLIFPKPFKTDNISLVLRNNKYFADLKMFEKLKIAKICDKSIISTEVWRTSANTNEIIILLPANNLGLTNESVKIKDIKKVFNIIHKVF